MNGREYIMGWGNMISETGFEMVMFQVFSVYF